MTTRESTPRFFHSDRSKAERRDLTEKRRAPDRWPDPSTPLRSAQDDKEQTVGGDTAAMCGDLQPERRCSLHAKLEVVVGEAADYASFAAYHYRDERPTAIKAVFLLRPKRSLGSFGTQPAGVIVYGMPNPRVALRRVATNGLFASLDRQTELALINRNVRCIARVIIEPRFRGIGLATRLVRETLGRMEVPIIEALAVCGAVNPFLERAGMAPFAPRVDAYHAELIEALSAVGIEVGASRRAGTPLPIDAAALQQQIETLDGAKAAFLERTIQRFLKSHGSRRTMPPGLERTRYILTRLTNRPRYYIWFHPTLEVTWP